MDTIENQTEIGKRLTEEVDQLEILVFGRKMGGWAITGLSLGKLKEKAEKLISK